MSFAPRRLATLALAAAFAATLAGGAGATSTTPANDLIAEGGGYFSPVIIPLFKDASTAISPLNITYQLTDLESGLSDFASGQADVALTEVPLSSAEATQAAATWGTYTYVPIAANVFEIATLIWALTAQISQTLPLPSNALYSNLQYTPTLAAAAFAPCGNSCVNNVSNFGESSLSSLFASPASPAQGAPGVNPPSSNIVTGALVNPTVANVLLEQYVLGDLTPDLAPTSPTSTSIWLRIRGATTTVSDLLPSGFGNLQSGEAKLVNAMIPEDVDSTVQPPSTSGRARRRRWRPQHRAALRCVGRQQRREGAAPLSCRRARERRRQLRPADRCGDHRQHRRLVDRSGNQSPHLPAEPLRRGGLPGGRRRVPARSHLGTECREGHRTCEPDQLHRLAEWGHRHHRAGGRRRELDPGDRRFRELGDRNPACRSGGSGFDVADHDHHRHVNLDEFDDLDHARRGGGAKAARR